MIKTNNRAMRYVDAFTDALFIFLSYQLALYVRFILLGGSMSSIQLTAQRAQQFMTAIYSVVVVIVYYGRGHYSNAGRHRRIAKSLTDIFVINTLAVFVYTAFLYLIRFPDFTRLGLGLFWAFSLAFVAVKRGSIQLMLRRRSRSGANIKQVVVIGSSGAAAGFIETARLNTERSVKVAGYVAEQDRLSGVSFLGNISAMAQVLKEVNPDEVVIALDYDEAKDITDVIAVCEQSGIRASIIPYYNDYLPNRPQIELFGNSKLINIRAIPLDDRFADMYKRLIDILGSAFALVLVSPILLVTAIAVKLTSPGPVFFCQERVGKERKPFVMYKFRSMRTDIDHNGWSTQADSRRTPIGSFIRKYSIDELPQFWNVLKGDMSLVGPRPELPNFVNQFSKEIPRYLVRQQVRPGITGWAQINGYRGDTSISKRIELDIWYIENWTWLLDIKILFRTAFGGFINSEKKSE